MDVNVHYYDITMKNSNISENLADNSGGAVYVVGTSLRINSSEISANHAKNGGALFIAAHGGMLVSNTYLHDNSANTSGGAVINNGYCKILQSTIASNHCNGSGIITSGPGTPETHIINSTISENQSVQGPVIDFDFGLVLVFSTITNNQSGSGSAAVVGAGGTSIIKDSIIINNRDDGGVIRNCDLQSTDVLGVNWDDDSSCLDFQIHLPSDLEPLADNGGACPTHSFPITSPARNNASNCLNWYEEEISTDERGIERPQGWQCDLGAYEFEENIVRPPTVSFIETANCRLRPDSSYPAMTSFKKFEKAEVIGRNINHTWYEVVSPGLDDPCWVWVEQVKFEGDLEDVPSRPPDTTLIVEDEEETGEEEPQDTPIPPSLKKHF